MKVYSIPLACPKCRLCIAHVKWPIPADETATCVACKTPLLTVEEVEDMMVADYHASLEKA